MAGAIFRDVQVEYGGDGVPTGSVRVDGLLFTVPTAFLSSLGSIAPVSGVSSLGKSFVTRPVLWPYGASATSPSSANIAFAFSLSPGYNVPTFTASGASSQADINFASTPAFWDGAFGATPSVGSAGGSPSGFWIGTS